MELVGGLSSIASFKKKKGKKERKKLYSSVPLGEKKNIRTI